MELEGSVCPYGGNETLEDSVLEHMVKNYNDLFDTYLDLAGTEDAIFKDFLETLVDSVVRKDIS